MAQSEPGKSNRVIFLIDMNAFFFMCEASVNHDLKGKAAAVAGDPRRRSGIILSASYEARRMGVRTTMLIHEAREVCPDIVLVPPSHGLYDAKSRQVMSLLSEYTPVVQQNSIDEAWLDLTGCESLFGRPAAIAATIMDRIKNELDLWCSIGISYNKFLAKMACEMKKPLGITELWHDDLQTKLWPLPVGDMYGVGKKSAARLHELAVFTIGELAATDVSTLIKVFGRSGLGMHQLANGADDSIVTEFPERASRSIGRSTTLTHDITDIAFAKSVIRSLAEEVGEDARKQEMPGCTVSIVIKYADFKSITRQHSVSPTYLTKEIYEAGSKLLDENWDQRRPVRLLGISLSGLEKGLMLQPGLFDLDRSGSGGRSGPGVSQGIKKIKEDKLEKTIDSLKSRFGSEKIRRASVIQPPADKPHPM